MLADTEKLSGVIVRVTVPLAGAGPVRVRISISPGLPMVL